MYNRHPYQDSRISRKQTNRRNVWRTTDNQTHPVTVRRIQPAN